MAKSGSKAEFDIENFIEDTTLHGLKNACEVKYGSCRRIVWSIILVIMFGVFLTSASLTLVDYFRYDSYFSTTEYTVDTLPLPSITICNLSPTTISSLHEMISQMHIYDTLGLEALLNMTDGTPLILKRQTDLYDHLQVSREQLIPWCAWKKETINCTERFDYINTDSKNCHIFMPPHIVKSYGRLNVKGTGERFGLTLMVDIHEEEGYFTPKELNVGMGVNVIVHDPYTWPIAAQESIFLAPGMVHHLGVEYKESTRLSQPYTVDECVSKQQDSSYKFEQCLAQCSLELTVGKCPCKFENCTILEFFRNCTAPGAYDSIQKECSHCKRNCEKKGYDISVTSSLFPTTNTFEPIKNYTGLNRTFETAKENVMFIKVFFRSLTYKVTTQHPSYEETSLLANIGGLIGLTLGASLITMSEIAEMFVIKLARLLKRCRKRNKKTTAVQLQPTTGDAVAQ